jgi:hypothetical protein
MPLFQQFRNKENTITSRTPIQQVADMNVAFGNPKGDFDNIDYERLRKQCANILDEYLELYAALHGVESEAAKGWLAYHGLDDTLAMLRIMATTPNVDQIRDSLCDIQVFAAGAQHFMGVNGDDDMTEVVGKVMTRFIKDEADKAATIAKHAAKGVTDVYFEGDYPTMVMKSASDQPDAPKGKFMKSASFTEPKFAHPKAVDWVLNGRDSPEARRRAYEGINLADKVEFIPNFQDGQDALILMTGGAIFKLTPHEGHFAYKPVTTV